MIGEWFFNISKTKGVNKSKQTYRDFRSFRAFSRNFQTIIVFETEEKRTFTGLLF